jgi:uncharacterized membrane protein
MVCLTLADFALDKFGGDSLAETLDNVARYRTRLAGRSFVRPGGGSSAAGAGPSAGGPSTDGPSAGSPSAGKTSGAAPAESE